MALCPFADHKLIPAPDSDPAIIAVGAVLHVDAGSADSLHGYFNGPSGGIESHFHVTDNAGPDGYCRIEQYRDTAREADAQYRGNSWVAGGRRYGYISIETEGYGEGEWSPAQIRTIIRLLTWLAETHDFPLRKATSPTSPGIGWHTMWGAPGAWTPVAKTCPGPKRIAQITSTLLPALAAPPKPVDKMDPTNYYLGARGEHVTWLGRRLVAHGYDKYATGDTYTPGPVFSDYDRRNVRLAQIRTGLDPAQATGLPGRRLLEILDGPPQPRPAVHVAAAREALHDAATAVKAADAAGSKKTTGLLARIRAVLRALKPNKKTT